MAFKETGKMKPINPLIKSQDISGTEFKLKFQRIQTPDGSFKTTPSIIRAKKEYHGNNTGILHKVVNMQYKVIGDTPSLQKKIDYIHTTTRRGEFAKKALKASYTTAKIGANTAIKTGLAAETATLKVGQMAKSAAWQKFKQNYVTDGQDDVNRGLLGAGGLTRDVTKGLINHRKLKIQHKLEKTNFQMKKEEYRLFNKESFKSKLLKNKEDKLSNIKKIKASRQSFNAVGKDSPSYNLRKALYERREQQFVVKSKILSTQKHQIKGEQNFAKKSLKTQKAISKLSKPGLLVLQPFKYGGKKMAASSWQKAISADERNDFMTAIGKAQSAASSIYQSRTQRLNKKQVKRDKLQKKNNKSKNALKKQEAKLGKKKSLLTKSKSKKKVDKVAEKGVAKTAQVIAMALKSPVMSIVAPYGAAIVIVLLIILLILSMFNGVIEAIFGNSSWVMGTYTAQDKYLSQAEEYYTKLAYDTNENIIKCGTDDWEDGLEDLEIDTDDMDDDPDNFYFGNSSHFPYNPVYDFDCYKLWSFLSAYYFNFETTAEDTEKGGEIEYWTYDGDTEAILDKLFKDEYKFEYYYDNTSRWEEKSSYDYYGGNFDSGYSYYKAEGPTKSWGNEHYDYSFKATNRPNEISEYLDDEGMLYIKRVNGEYRIVNPNNDWHNTGYLLQDQRFYLGDSAPAYYFKGGDNSKPYNFFINDSTKTRDSRAWDSDEAWFMITPGDSKQIFNDAGDDDWYYSVVKKYYWKTDCRLYYNVRQKKTFDEAIKSILLQESHGDERYQYYLNFAGLSDDENAKNMHGNHQSFDSPIDGSIIDSVENGKIYNGFGYDMMEWNKHHCSLADEDESHQAIDIIYPELSNVYAPMDGYIKEINFDESYVIIRKDDFNYWYDGDGCGKTRDTEITLYGVSVSSNLSEDDEVKKGDIIGYSLPEAKCEDVDNNGIGEYYLHVKIQIDTDGVGWDFIDPRLVFY